VLRRGEEFIVVTFWESMDAVRKFAGPTRSAPWSSPKRARCCASSRSGVSHYEVVQ
jgi:heme-degrading monooxygenase HmoA